MSEVFFLRVFFDLLPVLAPFGFWAALELYRRYKHRQEDSRTNYRRRIPLVELISLHETVEEINERHKTRRGAVTSLVEDVFGLVFGFVIKLHSYITIPIKLKFPSRKRRGSLHGAVSSFCLKTLKCFKWFCRGETRDAVELAMAEIRRDIREMKKEKRYATFIWVVVFWHTVGTIAPIVFDGARRLVGSLGPVARLFMRK